MQKEYTYLLINFLTIFFPLILSFDKKVAFFRSWKFVFPGLFLTGTVFLVWDHFFTVRGVWSFNPGYVMGLNLLSLPVEEVLFFITVPFACIFIYECLNAYLPARLFTGDAPMISGVLLIFSLLMLVAFRDRIYSAVTFGLLAAVLAVVFFTRMRIMARFYLAFAVSLLPFYMVNGLLTSLPVVLYNDDENVGLRVGTIPVEDHFYSLAMLLMNILFFEYFRRRARSNG
jgi:lycopene cyclase domain-containing protein